jgi:hypothetical protein
VRQRIEREHGRTVDPSDGSRSAALAAKVSKTMVAAATDRADAARPPATVYRVLAEQTG